jgi:hypothetical protein
VVQRRALVSDTGQAAGPRTLEANGTLLIYQGARAQPVVLLKRLSVANCSLSLIAAPLLASADLAVPLAARLSIAFTMATFGLSTTGFLAWFDSHPLIYSIPHG